VKIAALGLLTGWGEGTAALPADARRAAAARRVVPLERPALSGDRFRRATRECLLGIAAVDAMLRDGGLDREAIRGSGTALVYVTAAAYAGANRAFIEAAAGAGTLHFPYTAPSAVPAEVAIEFGLTGPYIILIGGADAAIDGLWQARTLLARRACERALVLTVDTFVECDDLFARARWLVEPPLVESAAGVLLIPDTDIPLFGAAEVASALDSEARARAGETLATGPLIALALARDSGIARPVVTGVWRNRRTGMTWAAPSAPRDDAAGREDYAT
jgi:hypothetical protein